MHMQDVVMVVQTRPVKGGSRRPFWRILKSRLAVENFPGHVNKDMSMNSMSKFIDCPLTVNRGDADITVCYAGETRHDAIP